MLVSVIKVRMLTKDKTLSHESGGDEIRLSVQFVIITGTTERLFSC